MRCSRRRFIGACAGSISVSLLGCMPAVETGRTRRDEDEDEGGGLRIDRGGGMDPDGGTPEAIDAGRGLPDLPDAGGARDAGAPSEPDAGPGCDDFVVMYDTYAQSLYFDGSLGPTTGVIRVDYVVAGDAVELEFWHGHGGVSHRYTVTPAHFESLKHGTRVTIETTEVEGHTHQLFIDPTDPAYRVPGAAGVSVPLC